MRRALIALIVVLVPALAVMAEHQGEYRDDFGDEGYGGNDGDLHFGGPWVEFGDDGSAGSGMIHIGSEDCSNNDCLHLEGPGLLLGDFGIRRAADLSALDDASLTFDIRVEPEGVLSLVGAELRIQGFDGSKWVTIHTYSLSDPVAGSKWFSLSSFDNSDFDLRFVIPGLLEGEIADFSGWVTIDRVVISGKLASTTTTTVKPTTTSTSKPTTTTRALTTTSTNPTTTTTRPTTTSTSRPETATTVVSAAASTTSSTSTTSTTVPLTGGGAGPTNGDGSPPFGGLRDPGVGLMADYTGGMMGDMDDVEVLGVELSADFSMAVEVFETARIWLAVLALMVAAAIIAGVDRRRKVARDPHS